MFCGKGAGRHPGSSGHISKKTAWKVGYKGNNKTLEAVSRENLPKPIIRDAISKREKKRNRKCDI